MASFRDSVLRTAKTKDKPEALANAVMGLCGESGEFVDQLKKHKYQGHALDTTKMLKELGDIRYYHELACYALDLTGVTAKPASTVDISKDPLLFAALGLVAIAGRFASLHEQTMFGSGVYPKGHAMSDLAEMLWRLDVGAKALGSTLPDVEKMNTEKLLLRFPDGFDVARSINRVDG